MVSVTEAQKPNLLIWTQRFLQARSLANPDGRPLYAYRVSDQEFTELSELLKLNSKHPGVLGPKFFAMGWLLYAAEWWKRSYDGGAWAWGPVFDSLGMPLPPYTLIQQHVDEGRKAWHLQGEIAGGKRYIGVVATQGGLPLRLIESAHGNLARLLRSVLRQSILCGLGGQAIRAEVEHQQHLLPHSFRQAPIYGLLSDVIQAIKDLHQVYALRDVENPVEVLNSRNPQWMDAFPLRIDSDSARQLLGGLIQVAAHAERGGRHWPFQMRRMLRHPGSEECHLVSSVDVLPTTTPEAMADLFGCEVSQLPPSFQVSLQIGDDEYPLVDGIYRNQSVRLASRRLPLALSTTTQSALLRLIRLGETLFRVPLPGSDPLEDDLPWVFDDAESDARLLAVGSVRVPRASALLYVPAGTIVSGENGTCEVLCSPDPGRVLYRLSSGTTRVPLADGVYTVCCSEGQGDRETLHWKGRILDYPSHPANVYLGVPALFRLNSEGAGSQVGQGEFYWKVGGRSNLVSFKSPPQGMGTLLWKYGEAVQTRLKAICLPNDAAIEFGDEHSTRGGTLWLKRWPALGVGCEAEDCQVVAERVGEDWRVIVQAKSDALPAEIELLIAWPGNQLQRLVLPFPGTGAVFFDASGKRLQANERLDVEGLLGTRLRLLPGHHRRHWEVCLALRNGHSGPPLLTRTYKYGLAGEIRLFEFIRPIREMLACTEMLDATVTIEALELNSPAASIRVGRYTAWLERDVANGAVGFPMTARQPSSGLGEVGVLAIPITRPDLGAVTLKHARSDGTYSGRWWFNPEAREVGPWLIYPDADSRSVFRPLVWDVSAPHGSRPPAMKGLRRALAIPAVYERLAALNAVVDELIAHPEDEDWILLEAMVSNLGHLPLSGLDIWRVFASKPQAMIMALLHLDGFAEQLAPRISEELPFEWSLTAPADWVACTRLLRAFWERESGPRGVRHLKRIWNERREYIGITHPGAMLGIDLAGHMLLEAAVPEAAKLLKAPQDLLHQLQATLLFENGPLQSLLRRPGEQGGTWPTDLKGQIGNFLSTPPARTLFAPLSLDRTDYKWSVIGLPVWLGFEIVQGKGLLWLTHTDRLHALRLYREFDPQWFDEAYRLGQILAFSTGSVAL